jgi:hypothetical protein
VNEAAEKGFFAYFFGIGIVAGKTAGNIAHWDPMALGLSARRLLHLHHRGTSRKVQERVHRTVSSYVASPYKRNIHIQRNTEHVVHWAYNTDWVSWPSLHHSSKYRVMRVTRSSLQPRSAGWTQAPARLP